MQCYSVIKNLHEQSAFSFALTVKVILICFESVYSLARRNAMMFILGGIVEGYTGFCSVLT